MKKIKKIIMNKLEKEYLKLLKIIKNIAKNVFL